MEQRERSLSRNIAVVGYPSSMPRKAIIRQDDNRLRQAIVRFMKDRELKPTPWAEKAEVPESTFRSFLSGKANAPRHDTLEKLARAADATLAEMVGERAPVAHRGQREAVPIKSLKVRASAGGGCQVLEEAEGPPFFFRREWIEGVLAKHPGRLRVHWIEGNSMEPTLSDGDVVLVHLDYSGTHPGAYVLWDGSGIVAKRIEPRPGPRRIVRVISDNAQFPPYEVPADSANVIGRIIWRGGSIS